jgi:hypothetical protein
MCMIVSHLWPCPKSHQHIAHLGQAQSDAAVDAAAEEHCDTQRRRIWFAPVRQRHTDVMSPGCFCSPFITVCVHMVLA